MSKPERSGPLLCLSSGLTPQYRVDVLTLLSLPRGTYIQFRYEEKLVAENLRSPLAQNELCKKAVLLAHVDCNWSARQGNDCPITPCRHAKLVSSRKLGEFYFLQFGLEEFAICTDLLAFQKSITGDQPHWISEEKREGLWCFEAMGAHDACGKEKQLLAWEGVIESSFGKARTFATSHSSLQLKDFTKEVRQNQRSRKTVSSFFVLNGAIWSDSSIFIRIRDLTAQCHPAPVL
jgi:hypothetical protein